MSGKVRKINCNGVHIQIGVFFNITKNIIKVFIVKRFHVWWPHYWPYRYFYFFLSDFLLPLYSKLRKIISHWPPHSIIPKKQYLTEWVLRRHTTYALGNANHETSFVTFNVDYLISIEVRWWRYLNKIRTICYKWKVRFT